MKIKICDVCKKEHNKITPTNRGLSVKGRIDLKVDLCEEHMAEIKQKFGSKITKEYIQYIYNLNDTPIDLEMAEKLLKRM